MPLSGMLGQIAIAILLFFGVLLYPYIAAAWITQKKVFECSRVEPADPSELTADIQDALAPSIAALETADFEFVAYHYIYAGLVGDPPAWGLLFRNATAQIYAVLVAPQPFHQTPVILCDVISVLENDHTIITTNGKNYRIHPQHPQETRIYRLNAPIKELLTTQQAQIDQSTQIALTVDESEFSAKILQHNLNKVQYGIERGIYRWHIPNQQYQYTFRSTLKLTFQIILEMIFPKTAIKRLQIASKLAQSSQVKSEAEAFLATLNPTEGLSKQKRGWLAIGSLAIFAMTYAIQFGKFDFGLTLLGIFLGALILHEGGHLAAMMLFGYRSPAVFFIPFFGALATARKNHASLTEKFWISMAGPLPGLILGIAIAVIQTHGLSEIAAMTQWYSSANPWRIASMILIFLNLFNLLPIYPLDGGQMADLLLFSRNPYLGVIYRSIGVGLLLLIGLTQPTMLAFGLIIALSLPNSYRIARWSTKLRKELKNIPWQDEQDTAELIFTRLQSAPKMSPSQRQLIASGIFADRRSDSAPLRSRIGLSLVYLVTLIAGITAGLYSIMPSPKMILGFANGMQSMLQSREARMKQRMQDLDAKILQDPKNPQHYRSRSAFKSISEDFKGALADANTAIRLDPKSPDSYTTRSRIYREMGDIKQAQADEHKAREIKWLSKFQAAHAQIKKNPKHLAAYIQRAEAKYGLDNREGAFQDLEYVMKNDPNNIEALFMRSSLYSSTIDDRGKNVQAAIKDLDRIIELQPENSEAYDQRSGLYSELGDHAKAKADAQQVIEIYARSPEGKANPDRVETMRQMQSVSEQFD